MERFDAIVIGIGAMGSAALCELARRGLRCLGLEQFDIGHDRGSSHGETRIVRKAYFEHPDYVPLLHRAYELWAAIEQESSRAGEQGSNLRLQLELFWRCGLLLVGRGDGPLIAGVRRTAAVHGLDIETVDAACIGQRWVQFPGADEGVGLFERDAGFLFVERCVKAMVELARMRGAEVRVGAQARSWRVDGGGVVVETESGQLAADRLIVCAGAWAGRMLADLGLRLEVRRKVQLWYPVREQVSAWREGPVFGFEIGERFFYGFPTLDGDRIKVALHTGGEVVDDPAHVDRSLHATDHDAVDEFVASALRGIEPKPIDHSVCMYTMTPDEHFVIDRHPEHEQVAFAAGFSGHGFKFAPIVGSILADYAIAGRTEEAAGFLRVRG